MKKLQKNNSRSKKPITPKQRMTLNFILKFRKRKQYMPSLEEISRHFRIAIVSSWERLDKLRRAGYIRKKKNQKRWIEIL